jgi:hypothetical protein
MKITVLEPAKVEMREANEYYEAQRVGLGDDFLQAVQDAIRRIEAFPNAWSRLSPKSPSLPDQSVSVRGCLCLAR